MKKKDFTNLRTKDIKTLKKLAMDKKLEVAKKKMEIMGGKEKNIVAARIMRRDLAQILTLVREKEILEKLEKKGDSIAK